MPVLNRLAEMTPAITEWRRDIHRNPELLFDTHRTAALVAEKLAGFGCDEVATGIGRTGVVGVIRGRTNRSGRVIGLRADMDALPILETTGAPWASGTPGSMHACGHDGHTAMLLGAAQYLAETRNFDGTVVVIFQPAEEGGGGAKVMVDEGMMERFGIQEVYGMHNRPGLPIGSFELCPGPIMASADQFTITVVGKGTHAGMPHGGIDTVLIGSQIVVALQSIVARQVDPLKSAVVSVTSFRTESDAYNVIPERLELRGTVRALDGRVQDLAEARLSEVATGIAAAMGGRAEVDYQRGYPVTVNSERETAFAAGVAAAISGADRVDAAAAPVTGAEDFSFMLERRPGAFIFMGNGNTAGLHHPDYDFNDEAIPVGCSYWVKLAETAMPA
jgi:hippurate hydrolase